jgi:hypothetical protein
VFLPEKLTPVELERQIPLEEVARLNHISIKTIERYYAHLIRRPSPKRRTMKLSDALAIAQAQNGP